MSRKWLALLTLVLCSPLHAADDLLSIYHIAKQSDPQFKAAAATHMATQELTTQARANFLPSIDLSANSGQTWRSAPGEDESSSGYSLTLNQPLYHRESYVAKQQANAQVAQAEADYLAAQQRLIQRVASAYFDTLAAQDKLQFARAEKASIERQLEQTKQRFEVGHIAITDVHESQAAYDTAVAAEIMAENQLAIAQVALEEITNQRIDELTPLADSIPLQQPEPQQQEFWLEQAESHNKELAALREQLKVSQESVEAARSGHYPTLDLQASHHYNNSDSSQFNGDTSSALMLQFNLPLYRGGQTDSQVRQSLQLLSAAQEQYEQLHRSIKRQVRSAYLDITASISQVKALEQALLSSQSALQASEGGLEVGTRTTVDVLNTRRELYRAKSNLAQAKYRFILSTLQLKQAAGILELSDLQQVNSWLKP